MAHIFNHPDSLSPAAAAVAAAGAGSGAKFNPRYCRSVFCLLFCAAVLIAGVFIHKKVKAKKSKQRF
ncbi:hypothetical protein KGF57_000972 [Candida theae]|uniref:Uncharacterized protein n=1 Tax=Candida theae TaxID=1198502 RepID=A0AAD5G0A6_9ASCO|nr:uncharacterized protein KGF57_000972 [Candida theae]KAI5964480.1 hypothetical protein KGF57_000972 [Candida theae]